MTRFPRGADLPVTFWTIRREIAHVPLLKMPAPPDAENLRLRYRRGGWGARARLFGCKIRCGTEGSDNHRGNEHQPPHGYGHKRASPGRDWRNSSSKKREHPSPPARHNEVNEPQYNRRGQATSNNLARSIHGCVENRCQRLPPAVTDTADERAPRRQIVAPWIGLGRMAGWRCIFRINSWH